MSKQASKPLWVVYLVAFDETDSDPQAVIEPFVGMDQIPTVEDAEWTAFMRGGMLLTVLQGDRESAEAARQTLEAEVLRTR